MGQLAYLPTTTSITSNYLFIEHSFPELYRLSQEVEKYYAMDHSCCLLKVRLFVELWCHEVSEKLKLRPPVSGDLINKIKQLSATKKIPTYIVDMLNTLRVEGNKSAHISQSYDGSWNCDYTLSKYKLDSLMKSLLELTQYLAYKLNLQSEDDINEWQAPTKLALQEDISASLLGSKEATFSLAKHFANKLQQAADKKQLSGIENKGKVKLLQHDLSYWLDRAHKQGHEDTWLLYAEVYQSKSLPLPRNVSIEYCYKQALKHDDNGQVAFQYSAFLCHGEQSKRGFDFLHQAGEKANHGAIKKLQEYYYTKDQDKYQYWVKKGLNTNCKQSYILDLEYKLTEWENEPHNDLLLKQVKTALTSAQAHQAEGVKYFKGYCDYHGFWGKLPQPKEGLEIMIEHHLKLPAFIHYEDTFFNLLKDDEEKVDLAIELSSRALYCCEESNKPQMKFDLSMMIWKKLQTGKNVKSPHSLKVLIRDAAKTGCEEALQFIKSPKGKALMRDNSVVCQQNTKPTVDRQKQKQAKKKARKAKR